MGKKVKILLRIDKTDWTKLYINDVFLTWFIPEIFWFKQVRIFWEKLFIHFLKFYSYAKTLVEAILDFHTITKNEYLVKDHQLSTGINAQFMFWIEPLLRGHLSYKITFSLFQRWALQLIVYHLSCIIKQNSILCSEIWKIRNTKQS
jgi:hypothetical protein